MVEPFSLDFRVFTLKLMDVRKFKNFKGIRRMDKVLMMINLMLKYLSINTYFVGALKNPH